MIGNKAPARSSHKNDEIPPVAAAEVSAASFLRIRYKQMTSKLSLFLSESVFIRVHLWFQIPSFQQS
jgi:hypothetical protein